MKSTKRIITVIITLVIVYFLKSGIFNKTDNNIGNEKDNSLITITKIVDGDTFGVIYNGKNEKVRLIGIDTPEAKKNKKAYKDSKRSKSDVEKIVGLGLKSKEFVKSIVKVGDNLKVEFDVKERDQYGRLLVYLYLKNGEMLNNFIIKEGYASPLTYPPNVKYVEMFKNSYIKARENNKGLWAE